MKTIKTEIKLDFDTFVKGCEKGYSGGGDDKTFTFTTFNNKPSDLIVPQEIMQLYGIYTTTAALLKDKLNELK